MKQKRLNRDLKWGFHHFPYYQMRVDTDRFHGLASLICLTDGNTICWQLPAPGCNGSSWSRMISTG